MGFCHRCSNIYDKRYNQRCKLCTPCWELSKSHAYNDKLLYWFDFDNMNYVRRRAPDWILKEMGIK